MITIAGDGVLRTILLARRGATLGVVSDQSIHVPSGQLSNVTSLYLLQRLSDPSLVSQNPTTRSWPQIPQSECYG